MNIPYAWLKPFLLWGPLLSLAGQAYAQQVAYAMDLPSMGSMQYWLYLPPDYQASEKSFPLLLFLHGGGESGHEIENVKKHGPPMLVEQGRDFPFLILSPQNPREKGFWDEHAVKAVLDSVMQVYRVDPNRVYLTGLSRGGYGAWRLAMQYPNTFAALVPICGATAAPYYRWLPDMPIWVFHGAEDPVIPLKESAEMVDSLRARGLDVRFTVYEGVGHNSWERAYEQQALYDWLLEQRRD